MVLQNASDIKGTRVTFSNNPIVTGSAGAATSASQGNTNLWVTTGGYLFEQWNTIALAAASGPIMSATGLNIDNVANKVSGAIEVTEGILATSKSAYVARTSPAFYVQATFNINTLANISQLIIGFRKAAAYNATLSSYTDFASIGVITTTGNVKLQTQLASGGVTTTDTTNTVTAATNFTVRINVDASGNVTYLLNGVAPTTVAAYQFAANTLIPFIQYSTPAGAHTEVDLVSYTCGPQ